MPQTPTRKREARAAYQAVSVRTARRYADPWTPADDEAVLASTGRALECALRLERTYYAVLQRRMTLRARLRP